MKKNALVWILMGLVFVGCGARTTSFGIRDSAVEQQIVRANTLIGWYKAKSYGLIETRLKEDLENQKDDPYATMHLMNELADLYSNFLFDLEQALDLDRRILALKDTPPENSGFYLAHNAANNRVLADDTYKDAYLNIACDEIVSQARSRVRRNESLLKASPSGFEKKYSRDELTAFRDDTVSDLSKCYPNTADYYECASRLLRAEYELYRLTQDRRWIDQGYRMILDGRIHIEDIRFSEIDFIALSDYLRFAYFSTGKEILAEYSLNVLYKPYMNIRSYDNRWLYNQMINNRINILIDAYYKASRFDMMLYYISLNKSRMVLEDKVKLIQNSNMKSMDTVYFDKITGLPDLAYFHQKVSEAVAYLDFYMDGHYTGEKVKSGKGSNYRAAYAGKNDASKSRALVLSTKSTKVFDSDYVYITYVDKGKVSAKRLDRKGLSRLHSSVSYPLDGWEAGSQHDLKQVLGMSLPEDITVSPDGWLASYPLSMLLGANAVRTLNIFTYGHPDMISQPRIAGYYNPTLDLPEAEQEKRVIEKLYAGTQSFVGPQADLAQLRQPLDRNILHLSMHGYFDAAKPDQSFLAFAGSLSHEEKGGAPVLSDLGKALTVKEMYHIPQLQNNDLVFTAACQTGLTAKGGGNENEVMGIMRPLLINNNKNIILTLWEVETQSAADFVKAFYERLSVSGNIRASFMEARDQIKRKYKEPRYWAPYVLVQNN